MGRSPARTVVSLRELVVGLACAALVTVAGCPQAGDPGGPVTDTAGDTAVGKTTHELVFTELLTGGYQGPESCTFCHSDRGWELVASGHWNWAGVTANLVGHAEEVHGKRDLINNFHIAVPSNEARCAQCHPSYGWKGLAFDFDSIGSIDCLVCHDTTGTYAKHPTAGGGGGAAALRDEDGSLTVVGPADLQEVAEHVGAPTRAACGRCHFFADGGDNVKRGDLPSDLAEPTRAMDVHMGGADFTCQKCHAARRHALSMSLHSVGVGRKEAACTRCHSGTKVHADNHIYSSILNIHTQRVACETCHIPTFARTRPTLVGWYWDEAGADVDPIPVDKYGQPTYDRRLGRLLWKQDVLPAYRWHNGEWRRKVVNVADTYTQAGSVNDPVVLAEPVATIADADAKIYAFKRMVGRQPADTVHRRLLVPHLFGSAAGANAYWEKFDWAAALREGTAAAGQEFSGTYGFVNTVMYLKISHEVAPREQALLCDDCHGVAGWFESLGYDADPWGG